MNLVWLLTRVAGCQERGFGVRIGAQGCQLPYQTKDGMGNQLETSQVAQTGKVKKIKLIQEILALLSLSWGVQEELTSLYWQE